jgi:hypothetical protein
MTGASPASRHPVRVHALSKLSYSLAGKSPYPREHQPVLKGGALRVCCSQTIRSYRMLPVPRTVEATSDSSCSIRPGTRVASQPQTVRLLYACVARVVRWPPGGARAMTDSPLKRLHRLIDGRDWVYCTRCATHWHKPGWPMSVTLFHLDCDGDVKPCPDPWRCNQLRRQVLGKP